MMKDSIHLCVKKRAFSMTTSDHHSDLEAGSIHGEPLLEPMGEGIPTITARASKVARDANENEPGNR